MTGPLQTCCQLSLSRGDRRGSNLEFHLIPNKNSEEFCWQLRGVASPWAVAIRSCTKAQLVISAEQNTDHWTGVRQLFLRLFQLAQQCPHQSPNAFFIRQLLQPPMCQCLSQQLNNLEKHHTSQLLMIS
ncbi:TPA: hypothetical protein ACH3X2_009387 [Trebouxia sp. C0005]